MPKPNSLKTRSREEGFFNIPMVVVAIVMLCLVAYIVPTYFMSFKAEEVFIATFGFVPALFAVDYSFITRMSAITYSFLHGSWVHLGLNMIWFVVFGSPLANRLGVLSFILFWVFTAVIAALTHFLLYPHSGVALVGASGAISGLMGAAARYGFQRAPDIYHSNRSEFAGPVLPVRVALQSRTVLVFIGGWFLLNVIIGIMGAFPGEEEATVAWEAHIGGLIAGFLTIGFFDRSSALSR